ncbi:BapA/Bap/LapF family prefix-like domain-containing protein, partial [Acinetobacter variabilis]|uniref:BapA/Bap/LapF family prefix-like domain-containing protein n=1 Tax=Acinetobacter variabilis TaxID=70346 RepID=UPI003AF91E87
MQVQVISKAGGNNQLIKEYLEKIELNKDSVVLVDVKVEDIEKIEYINNQAVITLKSGEIIVVNQFNPEKSSLVFRNEQSEMFLFDFETLDYNPIDKIEPLLYGHSESAFINIWPIAGLGIAGIGLIAGITDNKNSNTESAEPSHPIDEPTDEESSEEPPVGSNPGNLEPEEPKDEGTEGEEPKIPVDSNLNGKDGVDGKDGENGKSALELLIEAGELNADADINDLIDYLKGKDGNNGKSVLELLIEAKELPEGSTVNDLIEFLKGKDGSNGKDGTVVTIGTNGNWFIDGVDSQVAAAGKDGVSPTIKDGVWYIGEESTDIPVQAKVEIINGNWH